MPRLLALLLPALLLADVGALKKVVDGDTLYFRSNGKTVKCRIAYIDTPESRFNERAKREVRRCSGIIPGRMVEAGKAATRHARSLVSVGKSYRFDIRGRDRYGRSICIVRLPDGETYNERMVKDGYAVPFWKYIPLSSQRRFYLLEKEAASGRRGLWGSHPEVMRCLDRVNR